MTKVAVLMGSASDREKMAPAVKTLEEFGLEADEQVLSAHRTPDKVVELARRAREDGYAAIICGAGMAAHLAGAVAAHTTLPVIGVPLSGGALSGIDALYATAAIRILASATNILFDASGAGNTWPGGLLWDIQSASVTRTVSPTAWRSASRSESRCCAWHLLGASWLR